MTKHKSEPPIIPSEWARVKITLTDGMRIWKLMPLSELPPMQARNG